MHETKPSRTAIWVSILRSVDRFERHPIVEDAVADALVPMPYRPILDVARALPRASGALLGLAARVSSGRSRHLALRTRAIDDAIEEAVGAGARQVVLLGAGLDARAWRMASLRECIVFEVDHPSTQAYKRPRVAGITPRAREVRFVDVDLERQDLAPRLAGAGHDPRAPSAVVWEGVTMYLTRAAIETTLDAVARIAEPGSLLAMTYHSGRHIAPLDFAVRVVREPFVSLFAADEARALLEAHGFAVTRDESDPEWSRRYLSVPTDFAVERLVCSLRAKPR